MTDNEIIKALECCSMDNVKDCDCCPYNEIQTKTYCANELIKDALDLINRQKAEIERLRNTVNTDFLTVTEKLKLSQSEIGDIRAEAIKEFAERLKASQTITRHSQEGQCVYEYDDELIDTIAEKLIGKEGDK